MLFQIKNLCCVCKRKDTSTTKKSTTSAKLDGNPTDATINVSPEKSTLENDHVNCIIVIEEGHHESSGSEWGWFVTFSSTDEKWDDPDG